MRHMETPVFNPEPLWIARKRKDLTQKQAGARIGKARATINKIERGKIHDLSPETVRAYAEDLGLNPDEILPLPA